MKLQQVIGSLWIGPGNDVERVLREDYKDYDGRDGRLGILNTAHDYNNYQHSRGVVYLRCGLIDGSDDHTIEWHNPNKLENYVAAVFGLDYLISCCDPVFIHCHSGRSRSCVVSAIYISTAYNCPLDTAITRLSKLYPHTRINPGHLEIAKEVRGQLTTLDPIYQTSIYRLRGVSTLGDWPSRLT